MSEKDEIKAIIDKAKKVNYESFRLIVRTILNPIYLDVEIEAKIKEAYEYAVPPHKDTADELPHFKLTGAKKDKKVVAWYKKHKIINKIRQMSFY